MNGAELTAAQLQALQVSAVFSVAGASHVHLLKALQTCGINIYSSRHESGAVLAADGYARASRGLGVAMIVAEQGLANAIGGLASAHAANAPVLVLVALPGAAFIETRAAPDQHQLQLVSAITKYARVVTEAARLPDYLATAIHIARSGRPGPVLLGLPLDVVLAPAPAHWRAWRAEPTQGALPHPQDVARAVALLEHAERPLVIAGAGALWADAAQPLSRLVHEHGIPVVGNGPGRGLVPEDGELSMSWPFAQLAAREADCIVVVGARLTQRLGFGLPPRFSPHARFIQVDIDAGEAHRNRPIDVFLHADARAAVEAIVSALPPGRRRHNWLHDALADRRAALARIIDTPEESAAPCHPLRLAAAVARQMPADAFYVGDGADIQNWMYGAIRIRQAPGFLDHYPLGAMGVGTALAVGAAAAMQQQARRTGATARPVILVTGDGAFGFHPAELHAAALAGLRLVVIIGNDGAWGTEVHAQREAIGESINTQLGVLPYERVAEGFGCMGLHVKSATGLADALAEAFAAEGPVVINVEIDPEAGAALKRDPLLRMIMFSDIPSGRSELTAARSAPAPDESPPA